MTPSSPNAASARAWDKAVYDFYQTQLAQGSSTCDALAATFDQFGEDPNWVLSPPGPFTYSDGVKYNVKDPLPPMHFTAPKECIHNWVEATNDEGQLIEPPYDICNTCGDRRD